MCTRRTDDPLLRLFIDRYSLHLLAIPRSDALVGDAYVLADGQITAPGRIAAILEPAGFALPPTRDGEEMADVSGKVTHKVDLREGLSVAETLMASLGVPMSIGVKAEMQRASGLEFQFHEVVRDSMDILEFGRALTSYRLARDHPALREKARYFVSAAVLRAKELSIVATGASSSDLAASLSALGAAECGATVQMGGANRLTLTASAPLGFAVELYELEFDEPGALARLKKTATPIRVRAAGEAVVRARVRPAMIGGDDGGLFLPAT